MGAIYQIRRGTTSSTSQFVGYPGELIGDMDTKQIRFQDGQQLGGFPTLKAISTVNSTVNDLDGRVLTFTSGILTSITG